MVINIFQLLLRMVLLFSLVLEFQREQLIVRFSAVLVFSLFIYSSFQTISKSNSTTKKKKSKPKPNEQQQQKMAKKIKLVGTLQLLHFCL